MASGPAAATVPPLLVFCDLDDTLFDPQASIDGAARRAVGRLVRARIPIVFCSSRTRGELELIQQELAINQPFVSESGAAVYIPQGYFPLRAEQAVVVPGYEVVEFGKPYADIVDVLHRTAGRLGVEVRAFSDMSVDEVANACALPLLQARLAKLREYSEVFRIVDSRPGAPSSLL
jgi:mannosyl-3-phosphoglycerate phosphatase family protein